MKALKKGATLVLKYVKLILSGKCFTFYVFVGYVFINSFIRLVMVFTYFSYNYYGMHTHTQHTVFNNMIKSHQVFYFCEDFSKKYLPKYIFHPYLLSLMLLI